MRSKRLQSGISRTRSRHGDKKSTLLFAGNPLPMWIHDAESLRFLEVNESATREYGFQREEFLRMSVPDLKPSLPQDFLKTATTDREAVCTYRKKDGTEVYAKIRSNEVRFRGRKAHFVVAEDVTERRILQEQLFQMAHHDALTGLPNRTLLEQRMSEVFTAARQQKHKSAILCIDLDRFRQVNDWYGHGVGDECLKRVGKMLTRRLRGMDIVARTGGEEFTIVLGHVESVAAAGVVAKFLLQEFSKPLEIEGHKIVVGASIGVAVYPDHGEEADELWRSADTAMYRAKRTGGSRYLLVAPDMGTAASESTAIETHMREALMNNGFRLHYQVQYNMEGQVRGMEALLRLPHPTLGFVSPDRFIPLAEENGLIQPIGQWVIEEACRQLMEWQQQGRKPVRIAVNVSPLQLTRADFVDEVKKVILDSGVDPSWLEIEITERVVLNFDEVAKRMLELSAMGILFAVDDFGTGYSSLRHLYQLPISTVKIDRCFVQRLCESSRSYPIVAAIIAMGHSLNMQVLAEGVEEQEQVDTLRGLGCDGLQGFLLARPRPPADVEKLLEMVEGIID
jgi:diguanylate cyclase (GGDEF)-like protein/PAS domain S-box-containing protein